MPLDVTDEVDLVRIAISVQDTDLADAAARSARDRADVNPGVFSIVGTFAHIQGLMHDDAGAFAEAIAHFERAPRPLALASALEDAGRLCIRRGDTDDAVDNLGRALETYTRVAASWDAGRVRRGLRSLGVRRRLPSTPSARSGWAALTDSELAVVGLVVQGMTNREVAEQRVELAGVAARHGVPAH